MRKDKQIKKVIKGHKIGIDYIKDGDEQYCEGFVPYKNIDEADVIRYFNNNYCDLSRAEGIIVLEDSPETRIYSMTFQEFDKHMNADLESLEKIRNFFK